MVNGWSVSLQNSLLSNDYKWTLTACEQYYFKLRKSMGASGTGIDILIDMIKITCYLLLHAKKSQN